MAYYLYDKKTGLYKGQVDGISVELLSALNVGYTTIEPDEELLSQVDKYHKLKFTGTKWIVVPDYRGIWYHKETKEKLIVTEIGIEVDLSTYTDKEPCEFCIWDYELNDWVFSLDLYKEYAIKVILDRFYDYFLKREPLIHQIALTSLIARSLTILSTNKNLTDEQIDYLSNVIQECDFAFNWIAQVTEYELSLEEKVKVAETKEQVDEVLNSIDYEQFDSTYRYVTIGDKITEIAKITLTGSSVTEESDSSEVN